MKRLHVRYRCPDIHSQEDVLIIQQSLSNAPGVESIEVDLGEKVVTVVASGSEAEPEIRRLLDNAGYPPEDDA